MPTYKRCLLLIGDVAGGNSKYTSPSRRGAHALEHHTRQRVHDEKCRKYFVVEVQVGGWSLALVVVAEEQKVAAGVTYYYDAWVWRSAKVDDVPQNYHQRAVNRFVNRPHWYYESVK
jgi:hypothetical protein